MINRTSIFLSISNLFAFEIIMDKRIDFFNLRKYQVLDVFSFFDKFTRKEINYKIKNKRFSDFLSLFTNIVLEIEEVSLQFTVINRGIFNEEFINSLNLVKNLKSFKVNKSGEFKHEYSEDQSKGEPFYKLKNLFSGLLNLKLCLSQNFSFVEITNLITLDLNLSCEYNIGDNEIIELSDSVKKLINLKNLIVNLNFCNKFSNFGIDPFSLAISSLPYLNHFELYCKHNSLTDQCIFSILSALCYLNLDSLIFDLSDNYISNKEVSFSFLFGKLITLRILKLNLSRNTINEYGFC
jgi:hypothetical protein